MGYEFNPSAQRFEVPNPHKVENKFLLIGGIALVIAGLAGLFAARSNIAMSAGHGGRGVLIGACVFGAGLIVVGYVLSQLKFYFGREQPRSFSEPPTEIGAPNPKILRDSMRQSAVEYAIPHGPIDQLLYTFIPNLVFSPLPLQKVARAQFQNLLVLSSIVLSAIVAFIGIRVDLGEWVAMAYFGVVMFLVLRMWKVGDHAPELGLITLVCLAVASIVGPVLLSLSHVGPAPFSGVVAWTALATLALLSTAAVSALLLWAVTKHVIVPNGINNPSHTQRVSFNGSPNQLYVELDRRLQDNWTQKIPNRKYFRFEPQLQGEKGGFDGEVMEETQPIPEATEDFTLADCWASAEYRPLILLDSLIVSLLFVAAICGYVAAASTEAAINLVLISLVSWFVAMFGFLSSRRLWRRFRFVSKIYWIELQGNFQQAQVDFGNVMQDKLKTRNHVTNVEDMTLRTWVAALDSICYGRDESRWFVGFAGLPDEAAELGESLATHLREGRIIVAPSASGDMQRAKAIAAINDVGTGAIPGDQRTLTMVEGDSPQA